MKNRVKSHKRNDRCSISRGVPKSLPRPFRESPRLESRDEGRCFQRSGKKPRALVRDERGLPSLRRAYILTENASRIGFDWPNIKGILKKLDEEVKEFRKALALKNRGRMSEEIGDLLFVLANIARFLQINPEEALGKTLEKFILRFSYIETSLRKKGKTLYQSNLIEMDHLWEESKKKKIK